MGADFFQTLGISILQGRAFVRHDNAASPKVAVVNRALAEKFFPNENPIGKTFEADREDVNSPIQIAELFSFETLDRGVLPFTKTQLEFGAMLA